MREIASFYSLTLSLQAGDTFNIGFSGNSVYCKTASASFSVYVNDSGKINLDQACGFRLPKDFESVSLRIENGATPQVIELEIGDGDYIDNRLVLSPNAASGLKLQAATSFNTAQVLVTSAATLIKAANTNRSQITLVNYGAIDVYVGNSNAVTTGTGIKIAANGGSINIAAQSTIYAIAASGSNNVHYSEEVV